MSKTVLKPADQDLITALEEMMAARDWLNEKLVDWDEGVLPENIDELWFEGWKDLYPRIERSDLSCSAIYHKSNAKALFLATFTRYLEVE
jgi:hypothetical protein